MAINSDIFLYLFSSLSIVFAVFVISSKNPLHSIIYLILVFLNSACLLLYEGIIFIAFVILIIYIGAIAVLFLFVIYMLNINLIEINEENWTHIFSLYFSLIPLLLLLIFWDFGSYNNYFHFLSEKKFEFILSNDISFFTMLIGLAQLIYIEYYIIFLIIGFVLLIAMIGCIILTSRRAVNVREQDLYEQIRRYY